MNYTVTADDEKHGDYCCSLDTLLLYVTPKLDAMKIVVRDWDGAAHYVKHQPVTRPGFVEELIGNEICQTEWGTCAVTCKCAACVEADEMELDDPLPVFDDEGDLSSEMEQFLFEEDDE